MLRGKGFEWQFEGRWKHVHLDETATMVGRALTATFAPKRADLDEALTKKGHGEGHVGGRNSWPIDMLQNGDVYVANAFGSYEGGPIIGGNLSTAIFKNSQNGVVFDGSVRLVVSGLIEHRNLTAKELAEIRKLISEKQKGDAGPSG